MQAAGAKGGIAIVSSTATGDILAMANVTQDPTTKQVGPSTNNAALTTVYEPGSVMKIATVSAALEKGLVTPDTKLIVCPAATASPAPASATPRPTAPRP